jgi:sugar lactone lactonase YvrE
MAFKHLYVFVLSLVMAGPPSWAQTGPASVITTLAGAGSGGDGGPATAAQLSFPSGLAVDNKGNVYISDAGNGNIRRIALDGTISTAASNLSPQGLFIDQNENIYVAGQTGIQEIATDGSIRTIVRYPEMPNIPLGISVDSKGNIFVTHFDQIQKIDPSGVISTFAGTTSGGFSGMTIDSAGNLFVTQEHGICDRTGCSGSPGVAFMLDKSP